MVGGHSCEVESLVGAALRHRSVVTNEVRYRVRRGETSELRGSLPRTSFYRVPHFVRDAAPVETGVQCVQPEVFKGFPLENDNGHRGDTAPVVSIYQSLGACPE